MSRWGRLQNTGLAVWTAGAIEETMACASSRIMDFRDQIVMLCEQAIAAKGETEFRATVDKLPWLLHERIEALRRDFLLRSHVTLPEQHPQQKEAA